jgi:hypothetical protein
MPTIADYAIITDGFVTLPKANGDIDQDFTFDAPAVSIGSRSVLAFRVNPDINTELKMELNGQRILEQPFDANPQRSWHEVLPANLLKASGNTLTVSRSGGSGKVTVSNLVLFFQATI